MYARVARWEGAEADTIRATAQAINAEAASGPPEGLPAKALLLLIDPDGGRSLAISLFETEEDLRKGDETLNAMSPPERRHGPAHLGRDVRGRGRPQDVAGRLPTVKRGPYRLDRGHNSTVVASTSPARQAW